MLNQVKIVGAFLLALAAGNATFFVTLSGKKYSVNLLKNGAATAPNLSAIATLSNAALSMALAGIATSVIKIGMTNWSVTVSEVA